MKFGLSDKDIRQREEARLAPRLKRRAERLRNGWFAWRPVVLDDGRWVWLQRVTIKEFVWWIGGTRYALKAYKDLPRQTFVTETLEERK